MKLDAFDYHLPPERIAQRPVGRRDAARLLAHDLDAGATRHLRVHDLVELLEPGDLLVVNDTRVLPSRLFGRRGSGGRVELLLLEPVAGERATWSALVQPARKLRPGEVVELEGGALAARMRERTRDAEGAATARWQVELRSAAGGVLAEEQLLAALERHGHLPLPPYVRRRPGDPEEQLDRERYQTVYARAPGAVAAPTAGLHFTPELLERLSGHGVDRVAVTLHVGLGTFQPIQCEDVEEHRMHGERFSLPDEVARAVDAARARGGRVVAVGTTSLRVLETCATGDGRVEPRSGVTHLYLHPGKRFRVVDALFTNFHLPRSSLLLLVCAFAGHERTLALYRTAVEEGYRFYSYGDAMFLHRPRGPGRPLQAPGVRPVR